MEDADVIPSKCDHCGYSNSYYIKMWNSLQERWEWWCKSCLGEAQSV